MIKWAVATPIFLSLCFLLIWEGILLSQKPQYEGRIQVLGLGKDVVIQRDLSGVPHIEAEDSHSAFYALGYATAQDRLFQMELVRRLSQGRLAEILGEDLLPVDKMFRALLLKRWAEDYASQKERLAPDAWTNLDSYLAGVNSFLKSGNLPVEYKLLGIKPTPFERVDALSSIAYMGFSFAEGIRSDSLYSILEEKFPNSRIEDLFPRYDKEKGASIQNDQPGRPALSYVNPIDSLESNQNLEYDRSQVSIAMNPGSESFLQEVSRLLDSVPIFEGSNSWVLDGSRTESGIPILVNDPHIGYSNPGTWYIAHMIYEDKDIYGYFLPGVPYPLLGNTKDKAWGLTMLENDDLDLYYETLSEDRKQVLYKNKWVDLEVLEEEIAVKGQPPEKFTILKSPHGPIFSDFVKGYEGRPISLYWVFHHEPNPVIDILHNLLFAKNIKEAREGISLLAAPGLNFSYADRDGNIAWWGAGRFPIRNKITNTRKILEGSNGEADVIGYLPFRDNPQLENPKNGIIATANNLPSNKVFPRLGKLEGNWQPSDRFRRITEVLSKKDRYNFADMETLLLDNESFSAQDIWEVYMDSFAWDDSFWTSVRPHDWDMSKTSIEILSKWDFTTGLESKETTVYYVLTYFTIKNMLEDEMGAELFSIYGSIADHLNSYKSLIEEPNHPLWDDVRTKGIVENRSDILNRSLVDTVHFLKDRVGGSPNLWQWKNLYHVEYAHALGMKKPLNYLFNIGPFPTWGAPEVVNNVKAKLLAGDFSVKSGPSTRRIISFGDLDENRTILPTGNSGNLASPFYSDQTIEYLEGRFRTTNISKDSIEKDTVYKLTLHE